MILDIMVPRRPVANRTGYGIFALRHATHHRIDVKSSHKDYAPLEDGIEGDTKLADVGLLRGTGSDGQYML